MRYQAYLQSSQSQEGGQTVIGPFVFADKINQNLKQRVKHLYHWFKPNTKKLQLDNGRFNQLVPAQVLAEAQSFSIQPLVLFSASNNQLPSPRFLEKCYFPNLIILNLGRNKLSSFEQLSRHMKFPFLQQLHLNNNHFTHMRGIKRWQIPTLNRLAIDLNMIIDIRELNQARLPSLYQLQLYSNQLVDLRTLYRCHFLQLQCLQIYENKYDNDFCLKYTFLFKKFPFLQKGSLQT